MSAANMLLPELWRPDVDVDCVQWIEDNSVRLGTEHGSGRRACGIHFAHRFTLSEPVSLEATVHVESADCARAALVITTATGPDEEGPFDKRFAPQSPEPEKDLACVTPHRHTHSSTE